ncbi:MAG: TRAP transporter small permease subunit [Burkholderiales bacterium]|nr:TRAP transporter small permease subunit [Burkholderiales bacterium]
MLANLERHAARVARILALGAAAVLLALALATMADVLLRKFANRPIHGFNDVATLATAIIIAACFPALLVARANVTIRIVGSALGTRAARWLDAFGALVTAAFFVLMAWQYVRFSAELSRSGEATAILRWPIAPWWWVVAALVAVTALAGLVVLARAVRDAADAAPDP